MTSSISLMTYPVHKFKSNETELLDDNVAVEEPLEIRISFLNEQKSRVGKTLSVTMRTPESGGDIELAAGFLFTEGIIHSGNDIEKISQLDEHVVLAELIDTISPEMDKLERHFYTSSSCGVCGKTSIAAVKTKCPVLSNNNNYISVSPEIIYGLTRSLSDMQNTFAATGGLHASALYNKNGNLLLVREDVGRHNALDKLIGAAMSDDMLPLSNNILLCITE